MGLRCLEIRKIVNNKDNKRLSQSKRIESVIKRELLSKLNDVLSENDTVCIEVSANAVTEFLNVLDSDVLGRFEYTQISQTEFIFKNKEINF